MQLSHQHERPRCTPGSGARTHPQTPLHTWVRSPHTASAEGSSLNHNACLLVPPPGCPCTRHPWGLHPQGLGRVGQCFCEVGCDPETAGIRVEHTTRGREGSRAWPHAVFTSTPVWPHTPHRVHTPQVTDLQLTRGPVLSQAPYVLYLRSSGPFLHSTGAALLSSQCGVLMAPSVAFYSSGVL